MYVYHMHVLCPLKPEKGIRFSGTRIPGSCEPPCGGWELNLPHPATAPVFQCLDLKQVRSEDVLRILTMYQVHMCNFQITKIYIIRQNRF